MWKFVRLAALAASMVAGTAAAWGQDVRLADNAPQSYTVEQIRNPHLIYPGDVVRLDYVDGQPRLSLARGDGAAGGRDTLRLSPTVRSTALDREAIPSIPPGDIEPFLSRPLVTGPDGLKGAAEIVAGRDRERVVRGEGDRVYVVGIDPKAGDLWHIYRPVGAIRSHDLKEQLGYEYRHLGTGRVERFGEVSTVLIANALEEIVMGDRLVPAPRETIVNYAPHAPARDVAGRIIASARDDTEMGRGGIVTIDRGAADGVDVGTVRGVAPIPDPRPNDETPVIVRYFDQTTWFKKDKFLEVPEERTGLVFVFRVFDRVAYGLLVNTTDPVQIGDFVRKP
jgi:hypothetical protein